MPETRPSTAVFIRPDGPAGRTLRASVFTVASVSMAVIAHDAAGGEVSARVVACATVLVGLLGWALTRSRRSATTIGVVVVVTQLLLHAALMAAPLVATATIATRRPAAATTRMLTAMLFCVRGSHRPSAAAVAAAARRIDAHVAPPPMGGHAMSMLWMGWPMMVAHLLAAAVMAWWLACGERVCWASADRLARVLSGLAPVLHLPAVRPLSLRLPAAPRARLTPACITRRGPPRSRSGLPYRFAFAP